MFKSLTTEQAMRYNRQVVLKKVDLDGQEALLNASVCIIGVGGLGTAAATSLCASGVGNITLVDFDTVEVTNLPRQSLFSERDVGEAKVEAAKKRLSEINSECHITCVKAAFDEALVSVIKNCDVVLDCTDNLESRDTINELCFANNRPLVSGAAIRFEGQLFVAIPGQTACYGCLRTLFSSVDLSCVEAGIFSPVVNIVGTYQALLAMQLLMGMSTVPTNALLTFDGLTHEWQQWALPSNTSCPVCENNAGKQKTTTDKE